MAKRNIASGLVMLCVTIWYAWMTSQLPSRDIMPDTPGPSFFPWLITVLTGSLAILLVVKGFRALGASENSVTDSSFKQPAIMLVGFLAYVFCLNIAGFLLSSAVFFAFKMWMFGEHRISRIVTASLVIPVALFLIFNKGFQVLLPVGALGF